MREKLNEAVKAAMRAKDSARLTTLRMVTSKIKDIEVLNVRPAGQEQASEAEILDVLAKMVKQRRDSIEAFEKMARTDLADKEKAEIAILEEFMPKGLSEAEMQRGHRRCHQVERRGRAQGHGQGHGRVENAVRGPHGFRQGQRHGEGHAEVGGQ